MSRITGTDQRPKPAMPDSQPPVKRLPVDPELKRVLAECKAKLAALLASL